MLPNGPVPCEHRVAGYGQHGEATFLAWEESIEEDRPERISVVMHTRLRRTPIAVERRVALQSDRATLTIEETIVSGAAHPIEVLWGHHPTFAAPLIEAGTRIDLSLTVDAPGRC